MSRFRKWNLAIRRVKKYLDNVGIDVHKTHFKKEMFIINRYCNYNGIKGSETEKILIVSDNFKPFQEFVINQLIKK